jgi:hypothetical protein
VLHTISSAGIEGLYKLEIKLFLEIQTLSRYVSGTKKVYGDELQAPLILHSYCQETFQHGKWMLKCRLNIGKALEKKPENWVKGEMWPQLRQ